MKKSINIAYIGGGSRLWARTLMMDLAKEKDLDGEVRLFDIDLKAAKDNQIIGQIYQEKAENKIRYVACDTVEETLTGADFVIISLTPGTYEEMEAYVHLPEKYGIYQSVGDTTGPAGVMRGLIAFPIMVDYAKQIEKYCPNAWVINFSNPMTVSLQALHVGFPKIKAFGNCHEVFGTQDLLAKVYNFYHENESVTRKDILVNVSGINHFTWITEASCKGEDLYPLYKSYVDKFGDPTVVTDDSAWKKNGPFGSTGKIKFDLFKKFHSIAAAGDRHLVEFFPVSHYLASQERRDFFQFHLTPVAWRVNHMNEEIKKTAEFIERKREVKFYHSGETVVQQIKALIGFEPLLTNTNMINRGQADGLAIGRVVETNAYFRRDLLQPIYSSKLPKAVETMVAKHMDTQLMIEKAYTDKDFQYAKEALANDPLCQHMNFNQVTQMFEELVDKCKNYLRYYE